MVADFNTGERNLLLHFPTLGISQHHGFAALNPEYANIRKMQAMPGLLNSQTDRRRLIRHF